MNSRKTAFLFIALTLLPLTGTSALITPRHSSPGALLPNGDLFIAGGISALPNTPTTAAEIYSASDSEAVAVARAAMTTARSSHTITLLPNGRVLVAGGFAAAGTPLNTAQVFNPLNNTWAAQVTMVNPRGGHTATLLTKGANAGNVLLCGGQTLANAASAGGITNTCEMYSVSGGNFTAADAMSVARMGHTASLIVGGRVFVSGGKLYNAGTPVFTPMNEIYDPDTGVWSGAAPMNAGRAYHSAVVLNNGNILISGGFNGSNKFAVPEEQWYIDGNGDTQDAGSRGIMENAEMFDPSGLRVPVQKLMPYRNSRHSALLMPDGTHHMYGGLGNIPATFIPGGATLLNGTQLDAIKTSVTTATVNTTSNISFPINVTLSRAVNGRITEGDAFISLAPDNGAAISVANAKIYLTMSSAALDGSKVGYPLNPGALSSVVRLAAPSGKVFFEPEPSVSIANAGVTASNFVYLPSPLAGNGTANLTSASAMTVNAAFQENAVYAFATMSGTATILGGTVKTSESPNAFFTVNLTGGEAQLNAAVGANGAVSTSLVFSNLTGNIVSSTDTAQTSPANANGQVMSSLNVRLAYTMSRINLTGTGYNFDTSTVVIRSMIFNDNLVYDPADNTWTFSVIEESPNPPIFDHTALLTPAGDTVFLGGRNCETSPTVNCLRAAPALAPVSDSGGYRSKSVEAWAASTNLKTKRASHTSTLLPDGSILTCGGSNGAATLSSCELMNAADKTWSYTGSMNYPRARHTATLLPNGTVLAAGGTLGVSTAAIATAEIYSPDTKTWQPVKSMAYARQKHTATLLPDGNVLVTGGASDSSVATNTAEIFNTATSVWRTVAPMAAARSQHTATLLKTGNVLVAGGANAAAGGAIKTSAIYNPGANTWTAGPDLGWSRFSHTANLLKDGKVLVTGGSDNTGSLDTYELYNGTAWRTFLTPEGALGKMRSPRANHRSVLLPDGKLMVTGGEAGGGVYNTTEGYDPDFPDWSLQGSIGQRSDHTTVLTADGYLMNIGGWDGTKCLSTVDIRYFSPFVTDSNGLEPKNRLPVITDGTAEFDRGDVAVLASSSANFHGLTDGAGGAAILTSAFSGPRAYIQAIDSPSGFMTDITPLIYSAAANSGNWKKTPSELSLTMPAAAAALPYGWYHMRIAANGQFSTAFPVKVRHVNLSILPNISSPCADTDTGTLCGTSDPTKSMDISGELSNGMPVALTVPAGAFKDSTRISLSTNNLNGCGTLPVKLSVYSTDNLPLAPVTLRMYYDNTLFTGFPAIETTITQNKANLVLARVSGGKCLPLETRIDTVTKIITAELDHFSDFQLMIKPAVASLSTVRVYPNPLYLSRGAGIMTIDNLPASAKLRIYTLSGNKVWEGTAASSGDIRWRGVNSSGITVASGVYLMVIDSSAGKKVIKIAVER